MKSSPLLPKDVISLSSGRREKVAGDVENMCVGFIKYTPQDHYAVSIVVPQVSLSGCCQHFGKILSLHNVLEVSSGVHGSIGASLRPGQMRISPSSLPIELNLT
jgi:hypothetical protein